MTYTEKVAIDCINYFEDFLEAQDVRIPSSDAQMERENCLHANSARIYGEDFADLQETLSYPIGRAVKLIAECMYDLTLICVDFIRETDMDSRTVFEEIREWALEFENQYEVDDDYMTEIEEFGRAKFAELIRRDPITFDTYPNMFTDEDGLVENENYDSQTRMFEVPKAWALDWIKSHCYTDLSAFWSEYTYDDTIQMYDDAIKEGVLIKETIE